MEIDEIDFTDDTWVSTQQSEALGKKLDLYTYIAGEIGESVAFVYQLEASSLSQLELGKETGVLYGGENDKGNLLDKSKDTPVDDAISELLDNIFQNHIQNGCKNDLDVKIVFTELGENDILRPSIRITENSGGISKESITPFVKMGESNWNSVTETSVGTWGSGAKVGMACLGRWNRVFTHHAKSQGIVSFELGSSEPPDNDGGQTNKNLDHPKNYYHRENTNWYVKERVSPLNISEGMTQIDIKRITPWAKTFLMDPNKYKDAIDKLRMIFHCKIDTIRNMESKVSVKLINGSMDSEQLQVIDLADTDPESIYSGDFEKYKTKFSLPLIWDNRDYDLILRKPNPEGGESHPHYPELRMKIVIGYVKFQKERTGFLMWGNNRLFARWVNDGEMKSLSNKVLSGYSKFKHEPKGASWIGFVKFESSDPRMIPWSGPIKWGYHKANQTYADDIELILARIATSFMAQSGKVAFGKGISITNELLSAELTHLLPEFEITSEEDETTPEEDETTPEEDETTSEGDEIPSEEEE